MDVWELLTRLTGLGFLAALLGGTGYGIYKAGSFFIDFFFTRRIK